MRVGEGVCVEESRLYSPAAVYVLSLVRVCSCLLLCLTCDLFGISFYYGERRENGWGYTLFFVFMICRNEIVNEQTNNKQTRTYELASLDCCMLLLHHTHNRQRDEDEDGATCIAMRQYEKDDEWIWYGDEQHLDDDTLTDDTRTQNKLTSEAPDRVALATIQATADNTNFMVDKVILHCNESYGV